MAAVYVITRRHLYIYSVYQMDRQKSSSRQALQVPSNLLMSTHNTRKIPSATALGSAARVISRPITKYDAPAAKASAGVATRF